MRCWLVAVRSLWFPLLRYCRRRRRRCRCHQLPTDVSRPAKEFRVLVQILPKNIVRT